MTSAGQPDYSPERRPIKSREHGVSRRAAQWLADRGASPNVISVLGMLAGVAAGVALVSTSLWAEPLYQRAAFVAAAILMQLRLLANMLDGMVAVGSGRASPLGELYNEIPDRVSDTAAFVGAGYARGGDPVLGFVAALLAIFIAYVRAEGKVAGAHQEFCGPMAKPQRVFVLTLIALYCGLAPMSWQPQMQAWPGAGLVALGLVAIIAGEVVTALRRLSRIAAALRRSTR